jgi:NADH dehydrogenase
LVVGASGLLGAAIVRHLRNNGAAVRALVRSTTTADQVDVLRSLGAEIVVGDLRDAVSLRAACAGAGSVISSATAMLAPDGNATLMDVDQAGQLQLIAVARDAGVGQFLFVSLFEVSEHFPLSTAKLRVEAALKDSGLTYTIVRPAFFREVWLSKFLGFEPSGQVTLYGTGEAPVSYVAFDDVARFCAGLLGVAGSRNRVLTLGGPEPMSLVQVAERVFTGRTGVKVGNLPLEQIRTMLAGAPGPVDASRIGLLLRYAQGLVVDNREALAVVPLALSPMDSFLASLRDASSER